jgi:hypothetical protein
MSVKQILAQKFEAYLHQRFIISSDPAINGDLYCGEIDPVNTRNSVFYIFLFWLVLLVAVVANNKKVQRRLGNDHPSPGDQDHYLQPLMVLLPIFKFISMFSMLMGIVACNSPGAPNIAILKYNTMLYITSETIFWTVL